MESAIFGSTTISHGNQLMALYTTYPEIYAPGNELCHAYWQIRGNIKFFYGTLKEAELQFKDDPENEQRWKYDYEGNNYRYLCELKSPESWRKNIRHVIAFVGNDREIELEEPYHH